MPDAGAELEHRALVQVESETRQMLLAALVLAQIAEIVEDPLDLVG